MIMTEKNEACTVPSCNSDHDSFIFVSYAHQDKRTVFPIIERVHAGGYAIWYDKGITISSTWTDEIAIAIGKCKAFLLFVSKHSMESTYVRAEVEFALNQKIRVIPVYLDGMDVLPPGLALGLNTTQGVTEIDSPQIIAQQICKALEYNKVRREGEPVILPDVPAKKRLPFLYLGAAALAVVLCALFFFLLAPSSHITLEKTTFAPAEPIYVVLNDITQEQIAQGAILVVAAKDAKPEEYVARKTIAPEEQYTFWQYHPEWQYRPERDEKYVFQLHAPVADGKYTLRLHMPDKELTSASLVEEKQFTVSGDSRDVFTIATNKTSFSPYERIIVQTSGVNERLIEDGALVGLFKKDKPGNWLTYERAKERDEEKFFDAPKEPGEYEIQAHINNQVMDAPTLVASIPIQVLPQPEDAASALPRAPLLNLEKNTFAPVEALYIDNLPHAITDKDPLLTIAPVDARPDEYLSQQLVGYDGYTRSGLKMHVPEKPGKYELRLFKSDRSLTAETLIGVAEFTVAGDSSGAFSLAAAKTAYIPNEEIEIRVANVPKRLIEDGALVGIFKKNAAPGEYMTHVLISDRDQKLFLDAPPTPGEYEIRAHINSLVLGAPTLVAAIPFTVSAPAEHAQ
jgi:hypothetical protein